jgi:hypothetical protein
MKKLARISFILSALLLLANPSFSQQDAAEEVPGLRIGTFDSRLVALAYARSEHFQKKLQKLHDDIAKAKAAGDDALVKKLSATGPQLQHHIEQQSYSTWPIDEILEIIQGELPAIAKRARVDVIVSKWALVHQPADASFVDVTAQMVAPFKPSEATKKILEDMAKKQPLPLDQLKEHCP